jgi:hypothetical protein
MKRLPLVRLFFFSFRDSIRTKPFGYDIKIETQPARAARAR